MKLQKIDLVLQWVQKKCGLSVILDVINLHDVYFCSCKLTEQRFSLFITLIWPRDFSHALFVSWCLNAEPRSLKVPVVMLMSLKGLFKSLMVCILTLTFLGFIMCKTGAATQTLYMVFTKQSSANSFSHSCTELKGFPFATSVLFLKPVQ